MVSGITGVGWATLRLPVPSQSEGDGLAYDLTHAQSLIGGDPEPVAVRPDHPTPTQSSSHRWIHGGTGHRVPDAPSHVGSEPRPDRGPQHVARTFVRDRLPLDTWSSSRSQAFPIAALLVRPVQRGYNRQTRQCDSLKTRSLGYGRWHCHLGMMHCHDDAIWGWLGLWTLVARRGRVLSHAPNDRDQI